MRIMTLQDTEPELAIRSCFTYMAFKHIREGMEIGKNWSKYRQEHILKEWAGQLR